LVEENGAPARLRGERPTGINRHRDDAALGLANHKTVNKAALLGAERHADHVANLVDAGLGVDIADCGKGFALDDRDGG
jgi:hypothetical protein